jgi:putative hydrolase of the HAD superfamily
MFRAVFWDFGGVLLSSPFEAFNRYEADHGLPRDFIRSVNATDPDANAWAQLERNDITPADFDALFAAESEARGHRVPGAEVLALLQGDIRDTVVVALDRVIAAGYVTACLTNNVVGHDSKHELRTDPTPTDPAGERAVRIAAIMDRFDHVVESSKVGCRKPEPRFYELACEMAGVSPDEVVFLDDLGINLKPARAMGMTTIKVEDPDVALTSLERVLGLPLR